MAEFQWWLLLVGLVAGGGIVAVVMMDGARRDQDIDASELPAEATWIAARMRTRASAPPPDEIRAVLEFHREYLAAPPPDDVLPEGSPGRTSAD